MVKVIKYLIGIIITAALCFFSSYFVQYPFYRIDAREASVSTAILIAALSAVAVVVVYGGTALLNKHFKWYSGFAMATVPGAIFSVWHNISGAVLAGIFRLLKDDDFKVS